MPSKRRAEEFLDVSAAVDDDDDDDDDEFEDEEEWEGIVGDHWIEGLVNGACSLSCTIGDTYQERGVRRAKELPAKP